MKNVKFEISNWGQVAGM